MSTNARPRRLVAVVLAVLAISVGYRIIAPGTTAHKRSASDATRREHTGAASWQLRDGQWQRVDPEGLGRLLAQLGRRDLSLVSVAGTVREERTGVPIPNAEVVLASVSGESTAIGNDEGQFQVSVQPGFYRVFARADDYIAVGTAPAARIPKTDSLEAPHRPLAPQLGIFQDQNNVDLRLRASATIFGTVYNDRGNPVAGAVVSARRVSAQDSFQSVLGTDRAETDLDGSFRLLVPAGIVGLTASHQHYAGLATEQHDPSRFVRLDAGDSIRADLTMAMGCIISGRVIDRSGNPTAAGSLEMYIGGVPPNDYAPAERIDEAGTFRLARTEPGPIKLRAWPWKSAPSSALPFNCDDGSRFDDVVFVIPDEDPELSGVLMDANGQPIAHGFVDLFPLDQGGMGQQEKTNHSGEWAFFRLARGRYELTAYRPGGGIAARTVNAPASGIAVVLSGTGELSGHVIGIEDGAFTLVITRCIPRDEDGGAMQHDETSMPSATLLIPVEHGTFHVHGLPACSLVGFAETLNRRVYVETTIRAGQVTPISIDLR